MKSLYEDLTGMYMLPEILIDKFCSKVFAKTGNYARDKPYEINRIRYETVLHRELMALL